MMMFDARTLSSVSLVCNALWVAAGAVVTQPTDAFPARSTAVDALFYDDRASHSAL